MEQESARLTATYREPGLLLQLLGLMVFLVSLPLNVLRGDGGGMLVDPDHFQGWEVVWLGFWPLSAISYQEWRGVIFFPIAITSLFTLLMPIVELLRPRVSSRILTGVKAVGLASLILTTLCIVSWATTDGVFFGAVVWLVGAAVVVLGTLY